MYAYDLSKPIICKTDADCPTTANGVNRCNAVTGECKAPDTYVLNWDAGEVMSAFTLGGTPKTANGGLARTIYTWDPQVAGVGTDSLVQITSANVGAINAICNNCGFDANVVDFVNGNDGNGNPRPWALGGIINSTAAVIGAPEEWKQFAGHDLFEVTYGTRHPVAWVGSSDGMLHAIDTKDGAELFALIPPDKLDLQKPLYDKYKSNPTDFVMGQAGLPGDHVYGVANSPRFGDVFDGTEYRTLLFVTEGPGGTGIHALRRHPSVRGAHIGGTTYAADPNFGYGLAGNPPVIPLWSMTKDGKAITTALAGLANTWSIPALGRHQRRRQLGAGAGQRVRQLRRRRHRQHRGPVPALPPPGSPSRHGARQRPAHAPHEHAAAGRAVGAQPDVRRLHDLEHLGQVLPPRQRREPGRPARPPGAGVAAAEAGHGPAPTGTRR